MELRQELRLTQQQKLVLTQKLKLSLEMLQMPSMELEELIETELRENPLLEEADGEEDSTGAADGEGAAADGETPAEDADRESEEPQREDEGEEDPLDIHQLLEESGEDYERYGRGFDEDWYRPELTAEPTLTDHLLGQICDLNLPGGTEKAAEYVVYSLDRHGLLPGGEEELFEGWVGPEDELRAGLGIVRGLDPTGVGAASVREALIAQLEAEGCSPDSLEYRLVSEWFEELADRKYPMIAREEGVEPADVQAAAEALEKLDPWPGSPFAPDSNTVVIPDVIIEKQEGRYEAFLNDNRFPRLRISRRNRMVLESPATPDQARDYVKKKIRRASWFIRSIRQRQETILRIARFLADYQSEFFERGVTALRPLTLQQVAQSLGNNQSTVSRAINGKWVQTPRGVYEMRYFFSRGLSRSSSTEMSTRSVKDRIRRMVESEDPRSPMSDADITAALRSAGIDIKRRTVANYRSRLGIPTARKRRKY